MSFAVTVDPANPGQFFACCGLLELADRLWPGAEGWFRGEEFAVESGELGGILAALVRHPAEATTRLENGVEVKPLLAPLRLYLDEKRTHTLTLDAWMRVSIVKGVATATANPPWNFWSGQQTSLRIWAKVRECFVSQLPRLDVSQLSALFNQRELLSGRFGFDPGPAWNALDVGFSPNEQQMEVQSSPVVELLAAVGLQRFRPSIGKDRTRFEYATWNSPLPPCVASAVASGVTGYGPLRRYRGRVIDRGSYSALGYSTTASGDSDE
jgi:CRISPR-associated protein Csx14